MPKQKIRDISSKMGISTAEQELLVPAGIELMGQRSGGLSMFSDVFKRGHGDEVFGNDANGLWMGKADFAGAPFRVDYQGNATFTSVTISGYIPDGDAAADINANAVTVDGGKLTAGSVTATQILANTITASEIASNTITASQIAATTITAAEIVAGTITATQITGSTLSAIYADLGTITAGTINTTTINASSSGAINVLGTAFFVKSSGGLETGRIFTTGTALRIEATSSGVLQTNSFINFDNIAGTGIDVPGAFYTVRDGGIQVNNGMTCDGGATFTGGLHVDTGDLEFYDAKLDSTGSRYAFKDSSGTEQFSITPAGGGNTKITMNGYDLRLTSTKTAIVPTSEGYSSLYCAEAPEVWFFDFCDSKDSVDPLFLEVTEGDFKWIKTDDGGYQVWRRRKGHVGKRFTPKTEEQFLKNERFLSLAKK